MMRLFAAFVAMTVVLLAAGCSGSTPVTPAAPEGRAKLEAQIEAFRNSASRGGGVAHNSWEMPPGGLADRMVKQIADEMTGRTPRKITVKDPESDTKAAKAPTEVHHSEVRSLSDPTKVLRSETRVLKAPAKGTP